MTKLAAVPRPSDTRDRVLAVAQALFASHGYRGTSLRDISSRIGIKAPSLLHHFSSKEQLYLAVLDRIFARLEDAANSVLMGRGSYQDRMRAAILSAIDFIAHRPDYARILWNEFIDDSSVGRPLTKRRVPPLFAMCQNFIFQGQRDGAFRATVEPFHLMLSLSSITLGYFTQATRVRRLWDINLLERETIERRKQQVIDLVEQTLFNRTPEGRAAFAAGANQD